MMAAVLGALQFSCTSNYPKCDKDTDCRGNEANKDRSDYCINGQCQQCRPGQAGDCGPGKACSNGRCDAIAGYCDGDHPCPAGQPCVNNRCTTCKSDGDCNGGKCNAGKCETETRTRCKGNDDCAESEDCIKGYCVPANRSATPTQSVGCQLGKIFFDFNESVLSAEATSIIDQNADCIKRAARSVTLTGRTDQRGTQEYNLALSERRAQSVRERLVRLGVTQSMTTLPRGELDATGTDETGWARDRNVEFQWR